MSLSEFGRAAEAAWLAIPEHFEPLRLDAFVIMPNHVHGIIVINGTDRRGAACRAPTPRTFGPPDSGSLSTIVRSCKSAATREINRLRATPAAPVWQRNYYEHIVRNEYDLRAIRKYTAENPARWPEDEENPDRLGTT
ncbi:MAG: transposase [SAR324 cluster bacterium]|nr:transposase [SAR324 cluster bacterium]